MENSLVHATAKSSLPSFAANGVSYNDIAKMFLTPGWKSEAGNVYQEGLRVSDKIAVTYQYRARLCAYLPQWDTHIPLREGKDCSDWRAIL